MNTRHASALLGMAAVSIVTAVWALGNFDAPADTTASDTAQQFAAVNSHRRDTPNDPGYDCAEQDTGLSNRCSNLYDQRFDLFGFASQLTRLTTLYADPTDPVRFGQPQISGFNASGAWKIERGRPDVVIAVLDTGIRWNNGNLRTQIGLKAAELPLPRGATGETNPAAGLGGYDLNGNGALDVDDYANDARVDKNVGPNGIRDQIDAQDLIKSFSDGTDADGNGYIDDIAGWDFFDDDNDANDASSYFAAGNHGTGRMEEAAERGNDGTGEIGVCPNCRVMPIRIWDTFVSDGTSFGMGILYAAENGVSVIVGANGSLTNPAFTQAASKYAWQQGVVQTYSGDDLNTGNHNYPANNTHAMLIEGTVPDNQGLGTNSPEFQEARDFFCQGPLATACPGSNAPVGTYFRSANTAQFGGKSSISMWGSTGSQNTGRAGGAAGIVVSAGRRFSPSLPLSPDETRILLEQTAEDITAPNTLGTGNPDPAQPGWDSHFGWGRVDLGKAVQAVKDGNIPPEAAIITPDWYEPLVGTQVSFTGIARARRAVGGQMTWRMEWGVGQAPTTWTLIGQGSSTGTVTNFGTLNLATVRAALATAVVPPDAADATFSATSRHPLQDQFTVRLTVTTPGKMPGVDRKVLTALPDGQNLVDGYPKRVGSGGEAPIRYADINGDNVQELIVPLVDGSLNVYRPDGSQLPGFPVFSRPFPRATAHVASPGFTSGGVALPRGPFRAPNVVDLDNNGKRQILTAASLDVYVFNSDGSVRPGFPVKGLDSNCTPDKQRQENLHPKCGFVASPVAAWVNGRDQPPVILAPSMDGNLYAWDANGVPLSWSPRRLQDQRIAAEDRQVAEAIHNPAVGDLDGDGKDDVVVATNETYGEGGGAAVPGAPDDVSFASVGSKSTRVYAIKGSTGVDLAGWPVAVSGIIQDVLPFIGPGADPAILNINGEPHVVLSATGTGIPGTGSGLSTYNAAGVKVTEMQQNAKGAASNITDTSGGINLFESAVVGDLLGTGMPNIVKYQLSLGQVTNLLLVGQNTPYNHMIGAWDASTGTSLPAFPTITDDYQFLSSSTVAKMVAGQTNQVLAGTGLGLVHAYDGATGQDVAGFPKVTGGWLFAPVAISNSGRMAAITREGFLFEWQTNHPACQTEWNGFRHDEQGSGYYRRDGAAPGALANFNFSRSGSSLNLNWLATGDDGQCGTATRYRVLVNGQAVTTGLPSPAAAGGAQTLTLNNLPEGPAYRITVQAVDEVGNLGFPAELELAPAVNFEFIVRLNVERNTFITSELVRITGCSGSLPIAVSAGGQYSINRGPFTNAAGSVNCGDQIAVRHVSSGTGNTATDTLVTVGSFSTVFRSITNNFDRDPDACGFVSQSGVTPGAKVASAPITPTGFNTEISVTPGPGVEYRIGDGTFTSSKGRLQPGQSIAVRHTANRSSLGYTKTYVALTNERCHFVTRSR